MEEIKTKKYKLENGKLVSAGEGTAIRDANGVLYRNTEDYKKGITARMRCEGTTHTTTPVLETKPTGQSEQDELKNHIVNYCQKSGGVITVGQLSKIIKSHMENAGKTMIGGRTVYVGRTTLYEILANEGYLTKTADGYTATNKFVGVTKVLDLSEYGMYSDDEDDYRHTQPMLLVGFAADFAVRVYNRCTKHCNKLT